MSDPDGAYLFIPDRKNKKLKGWCAVTIAGPIKDGLQDYVKAAESEMNSRLEIDRLYPLEICDDSHEKVLEGIKRGFVTIVMKPIKIDKRLH